MMTWALVSMVKDSKGGCNHDSYLYHHNRALFRKLFSCIGCLGACLQETDPLRSLYKSLSMNGAGYHTYQYW